MNIPRHPDEQARLRALRALDILDTPREQPFDDLASVAAEIGRAHV